MFNKFRVRFVTVYSILASTILTLVLSFVGVAPASAFVGTLENGNLAYAAGSGFDKGEACNYLPGFETGYDAWHFVLTTRGATFQQDPTNPAVAINLNFVFMRLDGTTFLIKSGAWVQTGKGAYTYTLVSDRIRMVQTGTVAKINNSDSGMRLSHTCPGSGNPKNITPTASPSTTPTVTTTTASPTPTATRTVSPTPTATTSSPSPTVTRTASPIPTTISPSPTPTASRTPTPTPSTSATPTPTPTSTVTATTSPSPSTSPTYSLRPTPSVTPSAIQIRPTRPAAPVVTGTPCPCATPAARLRSPIPTPTPSIQPIGTSPSPTPSASRGPSQRPTPSASPSASRIPGVTPSPSATSTTEPTTPPDLTPPVLPTPPTVENPKTVTYVDPQIPRTIDPKTFPAPPSTPIEITKPPEYGTLVINPNGTMTYTPDPIAPTTPVVDVVELTYTNLLGATVVVRREFVLTQKGDVPRIIQTGSENNSSGLVWVALIMLLGSLVFFGKRGNRSVE